MRMAAERFIVASGNPVAGGPVDFLEQCLLFARALAGHYLSAKKNGGHTKQISLSCTAVRNMMSKC